MKIYGPYTRKDGRKHMVIKDLDGTSTSISYPKYLYELRNGIKLLKSQTIDHKDNNFTNDSPENHRILSRQENGRLGALNQRRK